MAKLHYSALASLDGFIADERGDFSWAAPDEEVHQAANDLLRPVRTQLYGRRMYDVLAAWETPQMSAPEQPAVIREFAQLWRATDKIVYSRSLAAPRTARTRIERDFDPAAVSEMKRAGREMSIGGPELAAQAFRARLVDEVHLFLAPVVVGRGKRALPDGQRLDLRLEDVRRFARGFVYLRYRMA